MIANDSYSPRPALTLQIAGPRLSHTAALEKPEQEHRVLITYHHKQCSPFVGMVEVFENSQKAWLNPALYFIAVGVLTAVSRRALVRQEVR
jgi:hypothetical protein